jgi:hypothetical protein
VHNGRPPLEFWPNHLSPVYIIIRLHKIRFYYKSRDSSVGIATRLRGRTIGVLGFDSRQGLGIFSFTTVSRTALGPIQPPIQWVTGVLSLGIKRPEREADHSPSNAEVKNCGSIPPFPNKSSWRGA